MHVFSDVIGVHIMNWGCQYLIQKNNESHHRKQNEAF